MPFLYESIHIRALDQYSSLVQTLQENAYITATGSDRSSLPLGHHIKYLGIEPGLWWKSLPTMEERGFAALLKLCEALWVFQIYDSPDSSPLPFVHIPSVLPHTPTLRYCNIRWHSIAYESNPQSGPQSFLISLRQLEVLRLMFINKDIPFPSCDISLPKLHTLILTCLPTPPTMAHYVLNGMAAHWTIPFLRFFSLTLYEMNHSSTLVPFLTAHGSNLDTLEFHMLVRAPLTSCPMLQDLHIDWHVLCDVPPLQYLRRIRLTGSIVMHHDFYSIMDFLYDMERPALICIQLLILRLDNYGEEVVNKWADKWSLENVGLEDETGTRFGPRPFQYRNDPLRVIVAKELSRGGKEDESTEGVRKGILASLRSRFGPG
jgi:hypothetical protein